MAATVNNMQYVRSSATGTSLTEASYVVPAGTNKILVVLASFEQNPITTISSITHNGVALTKRAELTHSGGQNRNEIWDLQLGDTTPTGDIVATWSGSTLSRAFVAVTLADVVQQAPEATQTASGTSSPVNTAITTVTDNALVLDVISSNVQTTPTITQGPTQVVIRASALPNSHGYGTSYFPAATAGSNTLGWTVSSGTRFPHVLVAYEDSSAAAAVVSSIDDPIIDAETGNQFSVSNFGSDINSLTIANGSHSISPTVLTGTGDGPYTFDMPNVAGYSADTLGIPFDTASWGSKVVTVGDGTDTATSTTVVNPQSGWAVVEVASAATTEGSVFYGWTGTPADTDQVYYPMANSTAVSATGILTTNQTTGTIGMVFFDTTDSKWKPFNVVLSETTGTAEANHLYILNYLGRRRHVPR